MKKTRLRTTVLRWLEDLITKYITRSYDRLDYHILEEIIFNKSPNMAEMGRRYGYTRVLIDQRLKKIQGEIRRLTGMVR